MHVNPNADIKNPAVARALPTQNSMLSQPTSRAEGEAAGAALAAEVDTVSVFAA